MNCFKVEKINRTQADRLNDLVYELGGSVRGFWLYQVETLEQRERLETHAKRLGLELKPVEYEVGTVPRAHLLQAHIERTTLPRWDWWR